MSIREFWAQALSARLFPLSIERGTKSPIGTWKENKYPTPEPHPEAVAVGIRCLPQDGVAAIDVDCKCSYAGQYLETLRRELHNPPVRFGNRPKFLIPFRCDGPIEGRSLELPCKCRVQIITGQFVAYGIHPDTQKPYEWDSFEAPWPTLNQIALYALLSYLGVNATADPRHYMSELDMQAAAPQNDAERASVRQFVDWRLQQLVQEIQGRPEGRGVPIFNAAAAIMPAVHWGVASLDDVYRAIEAAGHSVHDKRGGRSLGEEVIRASDAGVLAGNPLVRRLLEYRTFISQAVGTGITEGGKLLGQIMGKTFKPVQFVVDQILPEGFILFAAKPKVGKSYITFEAALSVTEGGTFWGRTCKQGDVLMYSFEDNERRVHDRVTALRPEGTKGGNFLVFDGDAQVPRVAAVPGEPCFTQHLERELCKNPNIRMVVIDPIINIRADQKDKTKGLYQVDYENIKAVQRIATKYGITIVGVHHSNKKTEVPDAADMASGTTGMTAAADGIWIMETDKARENAELHMQMRDADSGVLTLVKRRIKGGIKWEPIENAAAAVPGHGDIERRIIAAMVAAGCEANLQDLLLRCPDVNENTLRVYVRRMSSSDRQVIENTMRGHYVPKGMTPKSRPEGARDMLVTAATNGSYADFQAGRMVDLREVLPHLAHNDRAPVHEGYAVSMDSARALLAAFADPAKLIKDMESRKLAFVFDKVLLIPYSSVPMQASEAPKPFPWTLAGMMQQQAEKMPWQ